MRKVIVAGSRSFKDRPGAREYIFEELDSIFGNEKIIVISGDAEGVDRIGAEWAKIRRNKVEKMKPKWNDIDVPGAIVKEKNGKPYNANAGYARNAAMIQAVKDNPDGGCVVAFWDKVSPGTKHIINLAKDAGLDVYMK